ncbi:hypothetical protein ORI89_15435 [Sphingobacterium sp. UT-1RO-CII-1]|uniref:hypothetical protein n=1 Tax=Sphingobacterium sp. UT-1RO-CII-1 TaxID=2995225 RepID=UPI00227CC531|nr:hypothetical protein [Sphingobacterium sp. UT-1RO-CII-1]MCY4781052.1 hypothetical protein [Sphingobacterium sp. UT-1RO-CII-1]
MKKLFKNFNILGLVAFIAAGIFAISWTEIKKNDEVLWYQVELKQGGSPANNSDLEIVGLYPGGAPTTPCTSTDDSKPLCAKELELPASTTFPITMQDVIDNGYAQGDSRHRPE